MNTILIVDDEKNIGKLYEKEFKQEGYDVVLVENGNEALDSLNVRVPDVVVLDIRMPGMDGLETLGKMLAKQKDISVILNTAFASYQNNFMSWAADAYVIKSSDLTQLKQKVREVLVKKGKASAS